MAATNVRAEPATSPEPKLTKAGYVPASERKLVSAAQWQRLLAKSERERKEFNSKREYELSIEDLRDDAVAIVENTFGRGETGFRLAESHGGMSAKTYQLWKDKKILRPHTVSFRRTAIACGKKFGFHD
jgi:hypothetical protein